MPWHSCVPPATSVASKNKIPGPHRVAFALLFLPLRAIGSRARLRSVNYPSLFFSFFFTFTRTKTMGVGTRVHTKVAKVHGGRGHRWSQSCCQRGEGTFWKKNKKKRWQKTRAKETRRGEHAPRPRDGAGERDTRQHRHTRSVVRPPAAEPGAELSPRSRSRHAGPSRRIPSHRRASSS